MLVKRWKSVMSNVDVLLTVFLPPIGFTLLHIRRQGNAGKREVHDVMLPSYVILAVLICSFAHFVDQDASNHSALNRVSTTMLPLGCAISTAKQD